MSGKRITKKLRSAIFAFISVSSLSFTGEGLKAQSVAVDKTAAVSEVDSLSVYKDLQEFEIIASRKIETPEGYVINLAGENVIKGRNITETLSFLPNLSVQDKVIEILGVPVSHIYVDGVELKDTNELSNIPAEYIKNVEVKYSPGSSNVASETGGSIFIRLNTPRLRGFIGSLQAGGKLSADNGFISESASGFIKGRYDKFSYLISPSFFHFDHTDKGVYSYLREGNNDNFSFSNRNKSNSFRNRTSLSFDFSRASALRISHTIWLGNYFPESTSDNLIEAEKRLSAWTYSHSRNIQNAFTMEFETSDILGLNIDISADYLNRKTKNSQFYSDVEGFRSDYLVRSNDNLAKFKLAFSKNLLDALRFSWGCRLNIIHNEKKDFSYANILNKIEICNGLTPLVYIEASGSVNSIRYYAGLNWQMNHISFRAQDLTMTKSTVNALNPTVQVTLPFGNGNRNHSVMLSYSHNLYDIPYDAISNVPVWEDAHNVRVGNPDLEAPQEHRVRATLASWQSMLTFSAMYSNAHNDIYWVTAKSYGEEVYSTRPVNSAHNQNAMMFYAQFSKKLLNFWNLKLIASLKGEFENMEMDGNDYRGLQCHSFFRMDHSFTLPKGWGIGIFAFVEPTFKSYSWTFHHVYQVGGNAYKYLFNNRLLLSADFTAFGHRRVLDRHVGNEVLRQRYTTPDGSFALTAVWYFSGGKKVDVNFVNNDLDYQTQRSIR